MATTFAQSGASNLSTVCSGPVTRERTTSLRAVKTRRSSGASSDTSSHGSIFIHLLRSPLGSRSECLERTPRSLQLPEQLQELPVLLCCVDEPAANPSQSWSFAALARDVV